MKNVSRAKKTLAIIPSAGMGRRMGSRKKNYLPLLDRPVLAHTLKVFEECGLVDSVIPVVSAPDVEYCRVEIVERYGFKKVLKVIPGGAERQDSVACALKHSDGYGIILVHDGARPLVTVRIIEDTIREALASGAAICAVPVKDTVKEALGGKVSRTVPRETLVSVQTPQAFWSETLIEAFGKAREEGFSGTDESGLVERLGRPVTVVEGSYENIKITTEEDLAVAECILRNRNKTP